MNKKQKEILDKEREEHPAEVSFIELMDKLDAYKNDKKRRPKIFT